MIGVRTPATPVPKGSGLGDTFREWSAHRVPELGITPPGLAESYATALAFRPVTTASS